MNVMKNLHLPLTLTWTPWTLPLATLLFAISLTITRIDELFCSSIPSQYVSISPSEEMSTHDVTGDVVIIVPSSNSSCVQTVVAIDSDPEQVTNDSSGMMTPQTKQFLASEGWDNVSQIHGSFALLWSLLKKKKFQTVENELILSWETLHQSELRSLIQQCCTNICLMCPATTFRETCFWWSCNKTLQGLSLCRGIFPDVPMHFNWPTLAPAKLSLISGS